uniref:mRNA export factor GLE1 n=1 Tax=Scapholeberis mucronata TaxID=202097 RepID=A0A4Y7NK95_9CRUS|nr:EOG090X0755 [Scapholeberis mucronata]SVE93649.1 EOG090X0755 [Scapholeberis mucronata]
MNDISDHEMLEQQVTTPVKDVAASLSRTPKGKIVYDRDPLTPIVQSSFRSKSGVLLPEVIFNRHTSLLNESPVNLNSFSQPSLHHLSTGLNDRSTLFMDFPSQKTEKKLNQFKWQQELLLMRNTNQLEETTPVYNLSNHMIMQLFEMKEAQRMSVPSSFMKKIEDFEKKSRQNADEECLRKKQELEEKLVPRTESEIDVERTIQRLQEEARSKNILRENEINLKLREMQSMQEKEQQEEMRKRTLELQAAEAKNRKSACIGKIESLLKMLNDSMNSCLEKEQFLESYRAKFDRVSALKGQFEIVCQDGNVDDLLVNVGRGENIVKQIEDLVEAIGLDIRKNNASVNQRLASSKSRSDSNTTASTTSSAVQASDSTSQKPLDGKADKKSNDKEDDSIILNSVHRDDLLLYSQLQTELQKFEAGSAAFSTGNPSLKAVKFNLQKAVVHPINEISDISGQHLQSKLDRLRNLLQGNTVAAGTDRVRATDYPGGLEYCTDLLARKMVIQGEDLVSINPKAAFPIAAVIVELWIEFPAVGRLILANFYKRCPYLVPYYLLQKEDQSKEEYLKSLGYRYTNGQVEQQTAFLKRLSGIVRLYAAVIITLPRRQLPHPHGIDQAWRYLASLLNMPPQFEITAVILVEFLNVVGNTMMKEYRRQFQKVLHLLCTDYFTMIRNVTPKDCGGGPIGRLQDFLHLALTKGDIAPPEGQLPNRFW